MKLALPNNENLRSIFFYFEFKCPFYHKHSKFMFFFRKRVCSNEKNSCQVCPQLNEVFLVFAKVFQLQCFLRQFLSNFCRFFSSSSNFFVVLFAYEAEDTFSFRLFAEATPGHITLEVRSPFLTVANSFSFSAKGNL